MVNLNREGKTAYFSEEKQKHMQEHLIGMWAEDIWTTGSTDSKYGCCSLRFMLTSLSLKVEIKYATWTKFSSNQWKLNGDQHSLSTDLAYVIEWLNHFPAPIHSLMERSLELWEVSLRDYLVQRGKFKQAKKKHLLATQEYSEHLREDARISLFHQIYATIFAAYDDRAETEKDIWDMRKMGLKLNLTSSHYFLNFSVISQQWLRHLAKKFIKYSTELYSPGDCYIKLQAMRTFSQFLAKHYPNSDISSINRAMVVHYLGILRDMGFGDAWRIILISKLRVFLETCAHHLAIEGVTKDQLIFDSDFPKKKKLLPREIPEDVLRRLRGHLETLDTTTLRMVVILLECGMRISELCTLPLDCLICDDRHEWYLRFYQMKSKKEHVIPLMKNAVISVIQAQQEAIREKWKGSCLYLFPSIESHTLPYKAQLFARRLNTWAREKDLRDSMGKLYHFKSHQFRHTVGMRLINDDVPLDIISRLFGHCSLQTTQIYAQVRAAKVREILIRVNKKRKVINYQGKTVTEDSGQTEDTDAQLLRKGIRGQTLPIGGCGRPAMDGVCGHANKCLTCPFWLTSNEDLPRLLVFHSNAIRLRQRAVESGNQIVVQNQDHIITYLALRIATLEDTSMDGSLSVNELLCQLRSDLVQAESGLEEAIESGLLVAAKDLERIIADLKAEIVALEGSL